MDYRNFEKQIAQELYPHEIPLDTDALIAQIHGEKKRRKYWLLWFLLPIMVGTTLYGVYATYQNHDASNGTKIKIESQLNNTVASTSSLNVVDDQINISATEKAEVEIQDDVANQQLDNQITSTSSTNITQQKKSKSSFLTNSNQKDSKSAHEILRLTNDVEIDKEEEIDKQEYASFGVLNPLPMGYSLLESTYSLPFLGNNITCPDFSLRSKFVFELIPEVGLFLPLKNLESTSLEPGIVPRRQDLEQSLEGISAALYGKVSHRQIPFYFKAGVSWSKLTERTQLEYSYITRDTTKGIISITYSQTGDTITTIIGDIVTERKQSGSKTRHYTLQMWDLPIMVGYEKGWNQWFAGAEVGAIINLSLQADGNMLASDTSFMHVVQPVPQFKSKVGLSYTGGLYIGRDLNRFGRIYLSTRIRLIPDQFNIEQVSYRQQYKFLGLYAGYSYMF